jgi:hypothetical protein
MTQELLERTVHDWVRADPERGARTLDRLAGRNLFQAADKTTEEVTEALIQIAGRMNIAESRVW